MKASGLHTYKFVTAFLLCLSLASVGLGQTILFQEGFNTPGDGTRYTLERAYYETSQQDHLWTTVPNNVPGDNVIVYLEPGDQYFDGTEVPARRATFFADNDMGDQTPGIDLTDDGFALFNAAINWTSGTDGSTPLNINYVVDNDVDPDFPVEQNNMDVTLVSLLLDQGHEVCVTTPVTSPLEDFCGLGGDYDMVFMASHDGGDAVGSMSEDFKTTTLPLLSGFFHAAGALGFGSERGENTNNTYDLQIVDATHPLAGGFEQGLVTAVLEDAARQRFTRVTRGTIAPDAKVVATLPGAEVETPEDFTEFEGEGYLRGGHSTWNNAPEAGQPRVFKTLDPLNTASVENPKLSLSLAAASAEIEGEAGPYDGPILAPDNFDFIRILVDTGDGEPEQIAEFTALQEEDAPEELLDFIGHLASADGVVLNQEFQTLEFDLPQAAALELQIQVFTNEGIERVGIDNVQVFGEGGVVEGDCNDNGVLDKDDLACATADSIEGVLDGLGVIAGDLDANGEVAFADFLTLSNAFGKEVDGYPSGDIDVNGVVEFADFLVLSGNFGKTSGGAAAVPEPSGLFLSFAGVLVLAMRRRRK